MPSKPNPKNTGVNIADDQRPDIGQLIEDQIKEETASGRALKTIGSQPLLDFEQEAGQAPQSGERVKDSLADELEPEEMQELSDEDLTEVADEDEDILFLDDADLVEDTEENDVAYEEQLRQDFKAADDLLTAEYLGQTKGIDVIFPRSSGSTQKGKMIEWDISHLALVIGPDEESGKYVRKRIPMAELYALNPGLKEQVAYYDVAMEAREHLTSLLEDKKKLIITGKEVGYGEKANTLAEGLRTFELPGGIEGAASTSAAGYNYIEGKRGRNEDRFYVNPQTGFVSVIDAMGGGGSGPRAADIVAKNLLRNDNDVQGALAHAQAMMKSDPEIGKGDGTCLVTAKLEIGKAIEVNQCGDVDLYHFSAKGSVKYRPDQHLDMQLPAQSAFELFKQVSRLKLPEAQVRKVVNSMVKSAKKNPDQSDAEGVNKVVEGIMNHKETIVEPDNPLYGSLRKMVVNALTANHLDTMSFQTPSPLEVGDWVVVMSDGVSDNLGEGELEVLIRQSISQAKSPEQTTRQIAHLVDQRMNMQAKKNPVAEGKHYKLDNATIVIMRAKPETVTTVAVA